MQIKAEIKGEIAEEYLYEFINVNRGLRIYEISERLGWNAEEVYNLVKMLEEDGFIRITESEGEKQKRKVYPVGWKNLLPEDVKKRFLNSGSDIVGKVYLGRIGTYQVMGKYLKI